MRIVRWIVAAIGIVFFIFAVWLYQAFSGTYENSNSWQYYIWFESPVLKIYSFLVLPFWIIAIVSLMKRDQRINIILKRVLGSIGVLFLLFAILKQALATSHQLNNFLHDNFDYVWIMRNVIRPSPLVDNTYDMFGFIFLAIAIVYLLFWDWFNEKREDRIEK